MSIINSEAFTNGFIKLIRIEKTQTQNLLTAFTNTGKDLANTLNLYKNIDVKKDIDNITGGE